MHLSPLHVLIMGEIAKILTTFALQREELLNNKHIQINIPSGVGELVAPVSIFPQPLKFKEPFSHSW